MKALGRKTWVIAGGRIPAESAGPEPECTSRDELFLLNTGKKEATLELTVFHADRDPVGPYQLKVLPQRVRLVRVNDLIDPMPVPLGVPYGVVITSNVRVVLQFSRVDTSEGAARLASMVPFSPGD